MLKQIYQKLGPVLLVLVMLVSLFGIMTVTQAEETDTYSLTINYGTGCESVILSIPGASDQQMVSGKAYAIPKTNANITIRVVLKNGYEIQQMVGSAGSYFLDENNSRTWTFTADDTVTLECQPKEYDIKYLAAAEGAHIQPTDGYFPTSYTFGNEETKISTPVLEGYKFKYWILLSGKDADDSTGTILSPKEGEDYVTLSSTTLPNTDTENLYLKPKWEANYYEVYRYDYIYNPLAPDYKGAPLFDSIEDVTKWTEAMNSEINGSMGGDKNYPGFVYINDSKYYSASTTVTVSTVGTPLNIVYRLYVPLEYALEYVSGYDGEIAFAESATIPQKHTFDQKTDIPNPVRTGYVFTGWTVKVIKNGAESTFTTSTDLKIYDLDEAYAGDKDTKIVLTANWEADKYTIHIDRNTGADDETDLYDYSEKYVFDKGITVPDPVRAGYTFTGWLINGGTELKTGELAAFAYASDITLVAQWKANEYTVTLDGNGATQQSITQLPVVFDSALNTDSLKAALPVREGHRFLGFTLTKDGDDLVIDSEGSFLGTVWNIPADTTLYAKWDVIWYDVTVNVVNARVWLNDTLYEGTPIAFAYGTTIHVKVEAADTYKVTAWEGTAIGHTHTYNTSFVLKAAATELDISVLPEVATPEIYVDYVNEIFNAKNGFQNGTYQIKCGSETLKVKVQNGAVYVNDVKVTQISIPESFFGNSVEIVMFGDGTATADSDPLTLTLAERPPLPEQNKHIGNIYPAGTDSIAVELNPNSTYTYEYEFAVSLNNNGTGLVWKSVSELKNSKENVYLFEGLNPGTIYYVYVRVKASDGNYPHGLVNVSQQSTYFEDYLNKKISELQALIEDDDGELVRALIAKAIEDAKALEKPSATFYNDLEGIYNRAVSELPFARSKDSKIAELRNLRDTLIATGEFSSDGEALINGYYSTAVTSITEAQTGDEVQNAYTAAVSGMKAVKVTYLFYGDMTLTSFAGLPQGVRLFMLRLTDIAGKTDQVDAAIQAGKIAVGGNSMTLAEAMNALQSMDVMAAYTMKLTKGDSAYTSFNGEYELRLLLPEDLRDISGLQVAYYDETTSTLEVLDTERDGNYLVFRTKEKIADFVILGDPTVNLTGVIASLGLILLCQLVAIVLLLVRRSKDSKETKQYSFILPALLTIRFLPDNGLTVALILGVLVILFQIIIMYLLLSSDMVHRRRSKKRPERKTEEEAVPTMAQTEAENTTDEEPTAPDNGAVLMMPTEEEAFDDVPYEEDVEELSDENDPFTAFDDETSDEEVPAEAESEVYEDVDDENVVYVDTETGEVYGNTEDYDFIEPAANPRYSLPEEEPEQYDENAAESVDENGENVEIPEAASWSYDDEGEENEAQWEEPANGEAQWQDGEVPAAQWQYDDGEGVTESDPEEMTEENADPEAYELPTSPEEDSYYDDGSVRGEPAEDLPQEDPVTGEPAEDYEEEEPVTGELPEYEQEETKKYDGYEE